MRVAGACLCVWALGCLLSPWPSVAAAPETEVQGAELSSRLAKLEERDDAEYAEAAIEQARRALDAAAEQDDTDAASRKQHVAWAAIVLAERRLERRHEQAELLAAQRRLTDTRERARAQRRVLEALMRERAELARTGAEP